MIYFSKSELSRDTIKQERLSFSSLLNNWIHLVTSELKVTNPLNKEQGGVNVTSVKGTSLIAQNTKVFL